MFEFASHCATVCLMGLGLHRYSVLDDTGNQDAPIFQTMIRRKAVIAGCDWAAQNNKPGFFIVDSRKRLVHQIPNPAYRRESVASTGQG